MNSNTINKIFQIFSYYNPTPKTELEFTNHFTFTIAVILSAQATDISVNKATKNLFVHYDTPNKMLSLGEDGLKKYIKTIGLYNMKAKNIINLCKILVDTADSVKNMSEFDKLVRLPGIGRKTANVILNCIFKKPTLAVDTHVYRVSKRIGLSQGHHPKIVEQDLLQIIPRKWLYNAHYWLLLHGRYICKARKPLCLVCHIRKYCQYYKENNNV